MRFLPVALFALCLCAGAANADPCDTLIDMTSSALSAPDVSADQRSQLEAILNAGRAAKSTGDVQACEAAMTSSTDGEGMPKMSKPPMGGREGHACEKSLNSV